MSNQIDLAVDCKSVKIKYKCDQCGALVWSESVFVPGPDMQAEKMSDTYICDWEYVCCPKCGYEVEVEVCMGVPGGYVDVANFREGFLGVSVDYYDYYDSMIDDILYESDDIFNRFHESMDGLRQLLDLELCEELAQIMYRQLYVSSITCMEECLMSMIVSKVFDENDKTAMMRFVKKYKKFKDEKFCLSDIYEKYGALEERVKKELIDIVYHNIPVVKNLYKIVLEVDLLDISQLSKLVENRHHMVHRNGKDKDGNLVELTKDDVLDVFEVIKKFINEAHLLVGGGSVSPGF